jgi:hypothetical protein
MPTEPTATPEALDALIAASLQSRRETLLRNARRQRIATRVGFGGSACVALLALAAYFFAGDRDAAVLCASIAFVTFITSFVAWKAGRKMTGNLLVQLDKLK